LRSKRSNPLPEDRRKMRSRYESAFFIAFVISLCISKNVCADGFRIPGLSAEAMSRGEAVVASVSDASAVWYNPAALTNSGKMNLSLNLNNMFIPSKYTDLLNREEKNQRSYFPLIGAYFGSNIGTKNYAVGLGINTPFGLATEYSKTSAFRYITTGGEISLINFNPTVAYRIHPTFSIGVGLDYYYSTVELRQQYSWAAVGVSLGLGSAFPDGSVTVQGKGDGFGFNTGFLFQPAPEHSIGLTYRSQVVVKYADKKAELTNIPVALQGSFPAGTGNVYATGAKTAIRFPDIIAFGYAFRPSKKWILEIGGQWTNWDDVRSIDITLDQPIAVLFPNSSNKLDWKNSFAIRTGVEYQYTDNFSVSGGFFSDKSPTNEATYSPLVPDGDHHVFSMGAKYRYGNFTFQLPLVGMIQTGTDSINNQVTDATGTQNVNGKYSLYIVQLGVGVNYQFGE